MFSSIRSRIALLSGIPLTVALYFMVTSIGVKYELYEEMGKIESMAQLAEHVSALVHETQKERGATGVFMGSKGTKFAKELDAQRKLTDSRREALKVFLANYDTSTMGAGFSATVADAVRLMNEIDVYRDQASSLSISTGDALALYTQHNARMLDVVHSVSEASDNAEMARISAAYLNFLQGKERAGIERAVMSNTFARDAFGPGGFRRFGALVAAQETYFDAFVAQATPAQVDFYKQTMSAPVVAEVRQMREVAFTQGEARMEGFDIDPDHWFASMTEKINLMKDVENRLSADLKERAVGMRADARTGLLTLSGVVLGLVVGVVTAVYLIVRSITRPLNSIAGGLNTGAGELKSAAGQVSAASQQLAEGATEQAASLEETSSALEQMAAMTRTNAEKAKRANQLSEQTKNAAQAGDSTMTRLSDAMIGINESSNQIGRIIKVIEEIAFQTNLLALNAAVEAARAGDHGKGFAVVADEVRSLAQRAAQAAQETTALIEESVHKAREGTEVSGEVGEALATIVSEITEVSDLVNGITQASEEQAQGVDQVNIAVSQVDKVTQQNAANAEESASAAEELSAQSTTLSSMVDDLLVMVEGAAASGRG